MMMTDEQREELDALADFNDALGKASAIAHVHWSDSEPTYRALCEAGLVSRTKPPKGFSPARFFGALITDAGRKAINKDARRE